jgi:hypothetical protein
MTTQEIKTKAFQVIDQVIRLQYNVNYGCIEDRKDLETQKARLQNIKDWAIENNVIQDFRNYFASNSFGQPFQFIANDLSKIFNN